MSTIKSPSVSTNPALHYLYVLGCVAFGVGMITGIIAALNVVGQDPLTGGSSVNAVAAALQGLGFALAGIGLLGIVGGAVAQAINWQIVNPRDDSQNKSYREYKAEQE